MSHISFKEMKEEFVPEILEIYNYYIENSTVTFHIKPLSIDEMKGLLFFKNPKYQSFSIFDETTLCGYVILAPYSTREAFDRTAEVAIYFKPEYCSKGIGSLALQHIESFAKSKEVKVLISDITGDNEKSIRLFEKNGYIKCGHYKEVGLKFGRLLDVVALQKLI